MASSDDGVLANTRIACACRLHARGSSYGKISQTADGNSE
jgi:hypothetical protein